MRQPKPNSSTEPRVQIYDIPSGTISTIPARELAPSFVRTTVQGINGECWIDPKHLNKSPYQYAPFDEETRDCLREIKSALHEVYPMSLEEWEDGFRRDRDAEQEIAIWLHIAAIYKRLTKDSESDADERLDIFRVLLSCANNPPDLALTAAEIKKLSRPEAEAVAAAYYAVRLETGD